MTESTAPAFRPRDSWLWWLPALFGMSAMALGGLLLVRPAITALILIAVMSAYWLIEGVFDVILALVHQAPQWGWRLAGGIIVALFSLFTLAYPIESTQFTVIGLFWVLVIGAIISGILNIIGGLRAATRSWWTVLLGVLTIVLAALLLENPLAGTLALVPGLGIVAIVNGIVAIIWALHFRGQ